MSIFTIGYEGLDIDNFLALLRFGNVETIVDIRELPLSRKRGFSKNGLRDMLISNGFGYRHISELGCPKPIRDQFRRDGDWQRYTKDFMGYLASKGESIVELSKLAQTSNCALMCFEANFRMCHRSIVAAAVQRASGTEVEHLSIDALKTVRVAGRRNGQVLEGKAR